jgi:hypothetical protein
MTVAENELAIEALREEVAAAIEALREEVAELAILLAESDGDTLPAAEDDDGIIEDLMIGMVMALKSIRLNTTATMGKELEALWFPEGNPLEERFPWIIPMMR